MMHKSKDRDTCQFNKKLRIKPLTLKAANSFVDKYHRHHRATVGCKFAIGVTDEDDILCGVAICGRPVSRHLDDGLTLEINRVCTDGTRNACSMLYGACCRVAKAMGYHKCITYILMSENGASLRASNFQLTSGKTGGKCWTGCRRKEGLLPFEYKKRYERYLKDTSN